MTANDTWKALQMPSEPSCDTCSYHKPSQCTNSKYGKISMCVFRDGDRNDYLYSEPLRILWKWNQKTK